MAESTGLIRKRNVQFAVTRHRGHPWHGQKLPNFDLLEYNATTQEEADAFYEGAKRKYWKAWLLGICKMPDGVELPGGVLYKPSGWNQPWEDGPECPHPGGFPPSGSDL